MQKPILIKIGGSSLDEPQFVESLAAVLKEIHVPVIIVHGGGRAISERQQQLGISPLYIDGLRVTDETSLEIVEMVLCGTVNTEIVRTFVLAGLDAQGLNGMDRGLIRAVKLEHPEHDLGRVGTPTTIRQDVIQELLDNDVVPVIAPICLGDDGPYNVNADHVAQAVGVALGVKRVVFLTNVTGVYDGDGLIPNIHRELALALIDGGVIEKGMRVKVESALALIANGVEEVMITNLDGLLNGVGTLVFADIKEE